MFSPDGRLLQVEYAKKTVKQGSTAIGIVCKDGVVLVTDKRIVDSLVVPESVEKIFQIDDHIATTASGILSDARVLVERAQMKAQQNQVTYGSPVDILTIVKNVCDLKQICTQSGGLRPFGVSLLIAGIDDGNPRLFVTDPTGIYFEYKATVIGEGEEEVNKILHDEYKEDILIEDAVKLAVKALKNVLNNNFDPKRLDCVFIKSDEKKFTRKTQEELSKIMDNIKK